MKMRLPERIRTFLSCFLCAYASHSLPGPPWPRPSLGICRFPGRLTPAPSAAPLASVCMPSRRAEHTRSTSAFGLLRVPLRFRPHSSPLWEIPPFPFASALPPLRFGDFRRNRMCIPFRCRPSPSPLRCSLLRLLYLCCGAFRFRRRSPSLICQPSPGVATRRS